MATQDTNPTFFALDELLVPYPNQISSFTFELDFNMIMINVFGSKILRIISTIDHCTVSINQTVNICFPYPLPILSGLPPSARATVNVRAWSANTL